MISPHSSGFLPLSKGPLFGWKMDSQSRAFEAGLDTAPLSTPLPCPRRMVPQSLTPVTPGRLLLKLLLALAPVPLQRVPAVIKRRRG